MNAGDILSSCPLIVENVFKHLSLKDLRSCSKVCSLWKKEAKDEMEQRDIIYQLMRRIPFAKMVREITSEVSVIPYDWHKAALDILHEVAKIYLLRVFDDALTIALHSRRKD